MLLKFNLTQNHNMHLWGVKLQRAINASCHARKNDSGIALEALCATIY